MIRRFLTVFLALLLGPGCATAQTPFLVYYGDWDVVKLEQAKGYRMVILEPKTVDAARVAALQAGRDGRKGTSDDVKVLAYLSLGEDDTAPRGLPLESGDGPVYRSGDRLVFAENDFPAWYLDELRQVGPSGPVPETRGQDGVPDQNGVWGSFYVYAGDEEWRSLVRSRSARIAEELGVDGFFLDTLDTASRWGHYPWMEREMVELVELMRAWHPGKVLVGNRGLSLFLDYGPRMARSLDGLLFESFVTEWDWQRQRAYFHPYLLDQAQLLRSAVLPARAQDEFFLLFLNYRAPDQPEWERFAAVQEDLLKGVPHETYWTTPLLDRIDGPPSFGTRSPVSLGPVRASLVGAGRYRLDLGASFAGVLDVQQGGKPLEPLGFDGQRFELIGAAPGPVHVRMLGGPFVETTLPSVAYEPVEDLVARGVEGGVRLTWSPVEGASGYVVSWGHSYGDLQELPEVKGTDATVHGLFEGRTYVFSVQARVGAELMGLSPLVYAGPADVVGPPAPEWARVDSSTAEWAPVSAADLGGYRVYVHPEEGGLRLPLMTPAGETRVTLEGIRRGITYLLRVTAVDGNGNQGPPSPEVRFSR